MESSTHQTLKIFDKNECDYVISFWDDEKSDDGKGDRKIILKNGEETTLKRHSGNSTSFFDIYDKTLLQFFLTKLRPVGINNIERIKLMKYSEGDRIKPHNDLYEDNYKTLIIQLSDENDYKGGTLLIEGNPQTKLQGHGIMFLSSKEHEVTLLEKGTRYNCAIFLRYDDFDNSKSVI